MVATTQQHRELKFSLTPRFIAVTAMWRKLFNRFNGFFAGLRVGSLSPR